MNILEDVCFGYVKVQRSFSSRFRFVKDLWGFIMTLIKPAGKGYEIYKVKSKHNLSLFQNAMC